MRIAFGLMLVSWVAVLPAFAQAPPKAGTPEFFRALTEQRAVAHVAEDRAFYEKLLSKEFVMLGDNGAITNKADYLAAEFGNPRPKDVQPFYSFKDFRIVTARRDFAVVSYIKTEGMKLGNQAFEADARRLDTYALEEGEWRLVAMAALAIVKPPKLVAVEPEKLAEYTGRYEISEGMVSVISVTGDRLTEQTLGHPATILLPVGPDTFFDPNDSPTVRTTFRRDSSGKVIAWVYVSGDQEVVARKLP